LIIPFPESSLNQEAGKLFMEDYNEYYKIAKIYTEIHSKKNDNKSNKIIQIKKQYELERNETNHTSKSKTKANSDVGFPLKLDLKDYLHIKTQKLTSIKIHNSLVEYESSPELVLFNKNELKSQNKNNFVSSYTDYYESGNKIINYFQDPNNENDKILSDICNYKIFNQKFDDYLLNANSSFKVATLDDLANIKDKIILNSFSFTNKDNKNAKVGNLFEEKQISIPKIVTDEKINLKDFSFGDNSFKIEQNQNQNQDHQTSNKLEFNNNYSFFNYFTKDNIANNNSESNLNLNNSEEFNSEEFNSEESLIHRSKDGKVSYSNKEGIEDNIYINKYNHQFKSYILKGLIEKENQTKKNMQNIVPPSSGFNSPKILHNQILISPKTYKITNYFNTENNLIEQSHLKQIPFEANNLEEEENYLFRESKSNLIKNNSSLNDPIQNHSIFKKKESLHISKSQNNALINLNNILLKNNNYITKDNFIYQEISNPYSDSTDINYNGNFNFSNAKKIILSPMKSHSKIKHSYLYSNFKSENCKFNPINSKNKIFGTKPSLVNLPMLRANNNYNNADYNYSLNYLIPKTYRKVNLKKYNCKTPNHSNKDEIQKWLSRL